MSRFCKLESGNLLLVFGHFHKQAHGNVFRCTVTDFFVWTSWFSRRETESHFGFSPAAALFVSAFPVYFLTVLSTICHKTALGAAKQLHARRPTPCTLACKRHVICFSVPPNSRYEVKLGFESISRSPRSRLIVFFFGSVKYDRIVMKWVPIQAVEIGTMQGRMSTCASIYDRYRTRRQCNTVARRPPTL